MSAVRSVTEQTYRNLELIVVDDGSADGTARILSRLTDPRIRVVHKENGGVESARREGIRQARGAYMVHMDQDDLYAPNAFATLVAEARRTEADVVVAHHCRFMLSNRLLTFGAERPEALRTRRTVDHDAFMRELYISFFGINNLPVNIWNKLYRTTFLRHCPNPPLTGHIIEDLSYNMHLLPRAARIALLPDCLYYYRWGGFTNRFDPTIEGTALTGYRLKKGLIASYNRPAFMHTTAIELLNYMNSHLYNFLLYKKASEPDFLAEARRIMLLPEVQESTDIVRRVNRYHTLHTDAMLQGSAEALLQAERLYLKKNRLREGLKRICLNL